MDIDVAFIREKTKLPASSGALFVLPEEVQGVAVGGWCRWSYESFCNGETKVGVRWQITDGRAREVILR